MYEKNNKMDEFYMVVARKFYQNTLIFIFARKINKIPDFT